MKQIPSHHDAARRPTTFRFGGRNSAHLASKPSAHVLCGLLSGVLLLAAGSSTANAQLNTPPADPVTFHFTDTDGGSISGHIDGLFFIPGTQSASAVWIDSVVKMGSGRAFPASHTLPYNWGAGGSFTVVSGVVTQAHFIGFRAGNPATQFTFDLGTPGPTFNHQSFNNGARQTGTSLVFSNIVSPNDPPTANAGADQSIHASDTVLLDGTASFDDNTLPESLDYQWSFDSMPEGSTATFDDAMSLQPSFVADKAGTYTVALVVIDEAGLPSAADYVDISSANLAPTAVATVDYSLTAIGQPVTFDGLGSTDPDGDELSYNWLIVEAPMGSTAALVDADTATPSLTPDVEGAYVVILEVSDFLGPGTPQAVVEITAMTVAGYAEFQILGAFDRVADLTSAEVTTQGNQQAFSNFLSAAIQNIQKGKVSQAIAKLNQAIERTDGCALRGAPDGNGHGMDWVTDFDQQLAIYGMLTEALDALQPQGN
jgi:hypothetical protein